MGEGHHVTTKDRGGSYDSRAEIGGRAGGRVGAEGVGDSGGREAEGSVGSIEMGKRRNEDL